MNVVVELVSPLCDCLPEGEGAGDVQLSDGDTLAQLMLNLGLHHKLEQTPKEIAESGTWLIMLNGRPESDVDKKLNDADRVQIIRWVPGG